MTLLVSLRIPDGIVIAGDSLSTMMNQMEMQADFEVTCPNCGHVQTQKETIPLPPTPVSTLSYAQKVFPFLKDYGVGAYGNGMVLGKSIYFVMRQFEQQLINENFVPTGVSAVAQKIGEHTHELLKQQLKLEGVKLSNITPEDRVIFGYQVVGYDDNTAKTMLVTVGREVKIREETLAGCTYSGQGQVVAAIWKIYGTDPTQQPPYPLFSLQDAIRYAEFLIGTTATHQQFARSLAGVGGDIDIALVTPFNHFKWIRQKPLSKLLEEGMIHEQEKAIEPGDGSS